MTTSTYFIDMFGGLVRATDNATIPPDPKNADYRAYLAWVAAGNAATPYSGPSPSAPTCQLWQLQAVCAAPPSSLGFTPPTWAAITAAVAALNNPAVTAFFAHGTNQIPSNSTTIAAIAGTAGISPSDLQALVAQAATVSIP